MQHLCLLHDNEVCYHTSNTPKIQNDNEKMVKQ